MNRHADSKLKGWLAGGGIIMLSLFALAFILRLIYLVEFSQYPTFNHLNIDQEYYNLWAKKILEEGMLGSDIYEMTPLYAFWLAFIYKFISTDLFVVRLIQIFVGSLTVVYIYKLASVLFEGRRTALVAGLASAFYGVFILYDGMVMKTFLSTFFAVMALYWIASIEERGPLRYIVPGMLVGLMCLVRENAVLLIPGIPLCFFINGGLKADSVKRSAVFVIGAVLVILPVTLRNYAVSGEFVPITTGGGEVIYMAYYERSNGYYVPPDFVRTANPLMEHEEFRQEAMKRTGRQMTRKQSSDYWSAEGMRYVRENPKWLAYLLYRKFIAFWNHYEEPDNQNLYFMKTTTTVLKATLTYGIIAPLGILGFFISLRDWRRYLVLYAFFAVYAASILITFNISRYRAPAVPILIIFSALYLEWLYRSIRSKSTLRWAGSIALLVLLLFGVHHRIDGREPYRDKFTTEYHKLAVGYMQEGDLGGARSAYEKMVELNPYFYDGHMGLGRIAIKEGRYADAVEHLTVAARIEPANFRAYLSLAVAYRGLGKPNEAQQMLNRALTLNPDIWRMK